MLFCSHMSTKTILTSTPVRRSHGKTQRFSFSHLLFCFCSFLAVWCSRDKTSFATVFILRRYCFVCLGFFLRAACLRFSQFRHTFKSVARLCAKTSYCIYHSVAKGISHCAIIVVHNGLFSRPATVNEPLLFTWPTPTSRESASPQSFLVLLHTQIS